MPGFATVFDGIIFVEGMEPGAALLGQVKADLSFRLGSQLKNLNDVKRDLAMKARSMGANAVLNFTYGQKSRWLAIDDVAFYGEGVAAILSDQLVQDILNRIANR